MNSFLHPMWDYGPWAAGFYAQRLLGKRRHCRNCNIIPMGRSWSGSKNRSQQRGFAWVLSQSMSSRRCRFWTLAAACASISALRSSGLRRDTVGLGAMRERGLSGWDLRRRALRVAPVTVTLARVTANRSRPRSATVSRSTWDNWPNCSLDRGGVRAYKRWITTSDVGGRGSMADA